MRGSRRRSRGREERGGGGEGEDKEEKAAASVAAHSLNASKQHRGIGRGQIKLSSPVMYNDLLTRVKLLFLMLQICLYNISSKFQNTENQSKRLKDYKQT